MCDTGFNTISRLTKRTKEGSWEGGGWEEEKYKKELWASTLSSRTRDQTWGGGTWGRGETYGRIIGVNTICPKTWGKGDKKQEKRKKKDLQKRIIGLNTICPRTKCVAVCWLCFPVYYPLMYMCVCVCA